jgi:hypothetical protein
MPDLSRAEFKKSSLSGANSCVEVAMLDGQVAVRDSKQARRDGPDAAPVLVFSGEAWEEFLHSARSGKFDPAT